MKIKELVISEIYKHGKISMENFINLCLYDKEGYYIKSDPIGAKNDFITAPQISQMFGEIIGICLINFWEKKIKKEFNLIELGPGTGTLISDIMRTASINNDFIKSMNLILIEKNKKLLKKQKNNFKSLNLSKIIWQNDFNFKKKNIPSIIYSNEFFDCFPIRQFYKKKEIWYEKFITYNTSDKIFNFVPQKIQNIKLLDNLKKYNDVKVAEISLSRNKYFDTICKYIKKNRGIIVTIDYGYTNTPDQFSLQTIHNHKKTHLFEHIGYQDISAHVNFDEFVEIASKNNLKVELFCTQKEFLISYGLKDRKNILQMNKSKACFGL